MESPLKLPVVKTLQWPADVIDAVLFLLCGVGRKVYMRSLGSSAEEIAGNLAEAMTSRYPEMPERLRIIRKIMELAEDHEGIVEWACEEGFNPGVAAAGSGPALRFDSRSRMGATGRPSTAPPGQPLAAPSSGLRRSFDEQIEVLEKRRKLAELERDAAAAEVARARAKHELASTQASGEAGTAAGSSAEPHTAPPAAMQARAAAALGFGAPRPKAPTQFSTPPRAAQSPSQPAEAPSTGAAPQEEIAELKRRLEQHEEESRKRAEAAETEAGAQGDADRTRLQGEMGAELAGVLSGGHAGNALDLVGRLQQQAAKVCTGAPPSMAAHAGHQASVDLAASLSGLLAEKYDQERAQSSADRARLQEEVAAERATQTDADHTQLQEEVATERATAEKYEQVRAQADADRAQLQEEVAAERATAEKREAQGDACLRELLEEVAAERVRAEECQQAQAQGDADRKQLQEEVAAERATAEEHQQARAQGDADRTRLQEEVVAQMALAEERGRQMEQRQREYEKMQMECRELTMRHEMEELRVAAAQAQASAAQARCDKAHAEMAAYLQATTAQAHHLATEAPVAEEGAHRDNEDREEEEQEQHTP